MCGHSEDGKATIHLSKSFYLQINLSFISIFKCWHMNRTAYSLWIATINVEVINKQKPFVWSNSLNGSLIFPFTLSQCTQDAWLQAQGASNHANFPLFKDIPPDRFPSEGKKRKRQSGGCTLFLFDTKQTLFWHDALSLTQLESRTLQHLYDVLPWANS